MSDIRADLEALTELCTDLLATPDAVLERYSDDIGEAYDGMCAVEDHVHQDTKGSAA